jgi:uncharacterized protein
MASVYTILTSTTLESNMSLDRNPNTGRRIAEDAELKPALQTILHSAQYPSHITLPIVPR